MQRQATLSDSNSARITSASRAFSARQLGRMARVGVRFWSADGVPPVFRGQVQLGRMTTRAAYVARIRVIRLRPNAYTDDIRHELAHAWDHVRTGRVTGYPDRMSRRGRERMIERRVTMWSESATKRLVLVGRRQLRLTLTEMRDRYRRRAPLRENSFDNPNTREGYSRGRVREFYAEGYSVFGGSSIASKSKLLHRAPELYSLLEREARGQGLPIPDREALERSSVF
jgi:hypothetical protein